LAPASFLPKTRRDIRADVVVPRETCDIVVWILPSRNMVSGCMRLHLARMRRSLLMGGPRRYGGTSGMALLFHGTGRTRHRVGSCGDVSRSGPPATVFRYGVLRYPAMARNGDAWNVRSIFASQAERLPHLPATCRQERRPAEFTAFGREPSDARFALGTMPAAKYAYPDRYGRFTRPPGAGGTRYRRGITWPTGSCSRCRSRWPRTQKLSSTTSRTHRVTDRKCGG